MGSKLQFYMVGQPETIFVVLDQYPHPEYEGGVMRYTIQNDPRQHFMSLKEFKQNIDNGVYKVI
jgi:hypothetical protein